MTSLTLHIFDAIARDQRVIRATEEEVEVEYVTESDESDDEYMGKKKKKDTTAENRQMIINLFGSTAEGQAVRVEVIGFEPYFYVRLPNCSNASEEARYRSKIEHAICSRFPTLASSMTFQLVHKKVLYGFTGDNTYPFVRIQVPSLRGFYDVRKFITENKGGPVKLPYGLKLYESNIDPMLRFFHMRNIQPCGWIRIEPLDTNDEDPLLHKIQVEWKDVHPAVGDVVSAPFHHAFWDVECYSHDGEFPVAQQGYRRVAKQLWSKAKTADEVPQMLRDAFQGEGCIKIPPLRHPTYPPKPREVATVTENASFKEKLKDIWEDHESCNVKQREERMNALTKVLDSSFGRMAAIAGDPIIQIGTVCWKTGEASGRKHVFVLGGCDDIPGVTVHVCSTEKELLLKWFTWVVEQNFDIFVGYNIFGFDEKYVWERMVELGIEHEECVQTICRTFDEGGIMELKEKFLSSSALGDNMLYMWNTTGRLRIDLLGHVKRKSQMPSYKLDSVAAAFLSGKLSTISPTSKPGQWLLKTKQKGDARVGRYVQVLDELGEDLTEKMAILEITADGLIVESDQELGAITGEASRWAVVKDDVPPKEIFRLHRGTDTDRAKVAAYCVQDCDLTLELYRKLEVFNEAMSMANVCSVPVSYIFTRGQGIKIESLIFKDCMVAGQLIEVLPSFYNSGSSESKENGEDSYEGAIVLDPEPGFYTEAPVGVCDFASLYPSTIISENISHDMLVWAKDYDNSGNLIGISYGSEEAELFATPGTRFTDIEFDIWRPDPSDTRKHPVKIKAGIRLCRYAQPPGDVKGSLPTIVGKLLAARKAKRNEMAKTDDPFKKALLDAEQNAYKVTANSLYGQLGSATFKIRLQHLAASVTAYGRKQILFAKDAIEQFYGPSAKDPRCSAKIVYGDTDSLFVCFNPVNEKGENLNGREAIVATIELTEEAGKFITGALKAPHDFEYDKVFYPFIIFSKKRYVGNKYEENPDEFKETSMGIVLKRRDNAPLLKMCYGSAIDRLLNHRDIPGAVEVVKDYVNQLVDGKMKLSQLTITKSLRAEYAASSPAHKMLADRITARDPGNAPASGDRIGYIYIKPTVGQEASKLQGDRIETPQYILEKNLQIDAEYYIEHQLMNPLSQLFALMLESIPGYEAPKAWPEDPDKKIGQREILAGNFLFKEGLAACRRAATRAFFGMMGASVPTSSSNAATPVLVQKRVSRAVAKPITATAKQTTLQNFFRDSAFIEDARLAKDMKAIKSARKKVAKAAEEDE